MLINLSSPENNDEINMDEQMENATHLDYLSNIPQDDLLRKFILQERVLVPEARCSECSNKSCKNCQVMQSYKSYAAYKAYERIAICH